MKCHIADTIALLLPKYNTPILGIFHFNTAITDTNTVNIGHHTANYNPFGSVLSCL